MTTSVRSDVKTSGGANVTPAEVEAALAGLPEVLEAYVTGVADPDGTAGTQIVAAAVVPRAATTIDPDEIPGRLKAELSAFKLPTLVWVCLLQGRAAFTESGKIKKSELATLLARRLR